MAAESFRIGNVVAIDARIYLGCDCVTGRLEHDVQYCNDDVLAA
jgi:hypothetical protein